MTTVWSEQVRQLARFAFDSNALIYLIEDRLPYAGYVTQVLDKMRLRQAVGVISSLVEMELLVKPTRDRDQKAIVKVNLFLRYAPNLLFRDVDRSVAQQAARVRARTGLSPVDAVIAATAIEERCDVIIGNDSAFASRVVGIPYLYLDDYI